MSYLNKTMFFICNDVERALGLETLFPNYHMICIDDNLIIDEIKDQGGNVFCLERELIEQNLIFRNSNKLINQPSVQEYIKRHTPEDESPKVIFFKIASNIEKSCEKLNYWILNTSSDLNKMFETKISQYNLLKDEAVNFPKTIVGELGSFCYSGLVKELGEKFVIQYARGHTGSSTIFIKNEESFLQEQNLYPKRIARIAKEIEGNAWTINACATRFGVLYGGLSYQITGVTDLTSREGGTVGNDWSKNLPTNSLNQVQQITERVGKVMFKNGFQGLFGLDLIVDKNNEVFLIEVNARQPASTSMHSKLMLNQGLIPLQVFHFAEFLFKDDEMYYGFLNSVKKSIDKISQYKILTNYPISKEHDASQFLNIQNTEAIKPISSAQVFLRNNESEKITVKNLFIPGIYTNSGELNFVRNGYSISDLDNAREFLIMAQNQGMTVSAGSELARIQIKSGVVNSKGDLEQNILNILLEVKKRLFS